MSSAESVPHQASAMGRPSDTEQLGLPGPIIVHDGVPAPLVGVTPFVGPVTGATKVTSEPSAAVVGLP